MSRQHVVKELNTVARPIPNVLNVFLKYVIKSLSISFEKRPICHLSTLSDHRLCPRGYFSCLSAKSCTAVFLIRQINTYRSMVLMTCTLAEHYMQMYRKLYMNFVFGSLPNFIKVIKIGMLDCKKVSLNAYRYV